MHIQHSEYTHMHALNKRRTYTSGPGGFASYKNTYTHEHTQTHTNTQSRSWVGVGSIHMHIQIQRWSCVGLCVRTQWYVRTHCHRWDRPQTHACRDYGVRMKILQPYLRLACVSHTTTMPNLVCTHIHTECNTHTHTQTHGTQPTHQHAKLVCTHITQHTQHT